MKTNTPTPSGKETEEETYKRVAYKRDQTEDFNAFKMCQDYHSERLRLSMPSEEEIGFIAQDNYEELDEIFAYIKGAKYIKELLTGK